MLLRSWRRGSRGLRRAGRRHRGGSDARPARGCAPPPRRGRCRAGGDQRPVHELQPGTLLLASPRRRTDRAAGRPRLDGRLMPGLIHGLEAERIRANLERVRERVGPDVEILAATKYVPLEEMGTLAQAGIELVGENRLQDLEAKRERFGDAFTWDFIGNVQSRKVKSIVP